jgi:histidinol dehydrogenase
MRVERIDWDGSDAAGLARDLRARRPDPEDVAPAVAEIVRDVERRGDTALRELTERLDGVELESVRVPAEEIERAGAAAPAELRDAMAEAAANIRAVAEAELAAARPVDVELDEGQRVRVVDAPVDAAGVYAPGGRAAYPSSVLMCCIPALVAGVGRIAVASPPVDEGTAASSVLAACATAEVEEVYAIGGAQAIAALAVGTESIRPVDLIAGPGSPYVVEAKRMLSARVGIDGIAGPTELVAVAGDGADPRRVALDICAQAEHGTDGLLVVVSTAAEATEPIAEMVTELAAGRSTVPDATVAAVSAPGVEEALELADMLAPEHLELQIPDAERRAPGRVAGCVFIGSAASAAFGDYAAGSNHVLPTGGAARFGRPLGPGTFVRRTSIVSIPSEAAAALAPAVGALARAEGFPVHGESAEARADENGRG